MGLFWGVSVTKRGRKITVKWCQVIIHRFIHVLNGILLTMVLNVCIILWSTVVMNSLCLIFIWFYLNIETVFSCCVCVDHISVYVNSSQTCWSSAGSAVKAEVKHETDALLQAAVICLAFVMSLLKHLYNSLSCLCLCSRFQFIWVPKGETVPKCPVPLQSRDAPRRAAAHARRDLSESQINTDLLTQIQL